MLVSNAGIWQVLAVENGTNIAYVTISRSMRNNSNSTGLNVRKQF